MAPPMRGSKHPITAYYSVGQSRKDERLSRPCRLVTYWNKVPPLGVEPGHVTHPSTNRARRRVTSLIRPMLLPLRHAATHTCSVNKAPDFTPVVSTTQLPLLKSPVVENKRMRPADNFRRLESVLWVNFSVLMRLVGIWPILKTCAT